MAGGIPRGPCVAALLCVAAAAAAEPLSDADLAKKNEGSYFTGLPLVNYTTDTGFGFGARAYYYYDGDRSDPRFKTTPYLYRVFLQGFVSTNGLQFHWLDFDAPKIGNTDYRIRSQLIYERNTASNYFGLGDVSLKPLAFPGSNQTFSNFNDYDNALTMVNGGQTFARYNQYDLERPSWIASVERLFFHDRVRALAGFGFSYARIRDYSGEQVDDATDANGNTVTATEAPTKLATDCGFAGQPGPATIKGCAGGWDNFLRFGVSYDTRDFEPDPNKGAFIDAELDLGTIVLGSQYDYARAMVAARGYWSPFAQYGQDIVFAGRALLEYQSSGTPFFSMDTIPFTDDPRSGLGGERTLRGYRQDRFVGPVMTLLNGEVRWTFAHCEILRQKFGFFLVPFIDIGRPYDNMADLGRNLLHDWRPSYGGAFRIAWNLATIITVDVGVSPEDVGYYVNFNHMF